MHKNKHKMHKIPIFLLFHDLGKIVMSSLEQYSKIPMFNLFVNWEKLEVQLMTKYISPRPTFKNLNLTLLMNWGKLR